jgi:NAD(P)-dependent dehydrogenase (short-subunit alcohol dehydrogenase family)
VDVFINNAALKENFMGRPEGVYGAWDAKFWELDAQRVRRLVEVNTLGTYHGSRVAAAAMAARGRGSIMNVSTSKSTQVAGGHFPYGPSKSFIDSFSIAGAEQLEPFGVRMNAILPGGRVDLRDASRPGGRPYDIMVPLTLYLASDASAHITGRVLIAEEFNRGGMLT